MKLVLILYLTWSSNCLFYSTRVRATVMKMINVLTGWYALQKGDSVIRRLIRFPSWPVIKKRLGTWPVEDWPKWFVFLHSCMKWHLPGGLWDPDDDCCERRFFSAAKDLETGKIVIFTFLLGAPQTTPAPMVRVTVFLIRTVRGTDITSVGRPA